MEIDEWAFRFLEGFRFEAEKLKKEETVVFTPFIKEQMLTEPCQVEVFQFAQPQRIVLLFFFDFTKQDGMVENYDGEWQQLAEIVEHFMRKYSLLNISPIQLFNMLSDAKTLKEHRYIQ